MKQKTISIVSTAATSSKDHLRFPVDDHTEKTVTVKTSNGEREVTYHLYEHVTYVANPVDAEFQSLNVKVPIKVDGRAVDAANAPILFDINVAGYLATVAGIGPKSRPSGGPRPVVDPGLVLAAGYVLVESGCRGRDNQAKDGTYYGKAPAAIVDLKAAVRYIRHNKGVMPGNTDWIISTGGSAGGALSALLGASGNSHLYDAYFEELGAADEDDSVFASADFCPITDLEHADMAHEWEFGTTPINGTLVDQGPSQQMNYSRGKPRGILHQVRTRVRGKPRGIYPTRLKNAFSEYLMSLNLEGKNGFGPLTADNYGEYLVRTYLVPSATKYLLALTDEERTTYLAENTWITWPNNSATFTFETYVAHLGRLKNPPAFDDINCPRLRPSSSVMGRPMHVISQTSAFGKLAVTRVQSLTTT